MLKYPHMWYNMLMIFIMTASFPSICISGNISLALTLFFIWMICLYLACDTIYVNFSDKVMNILSKWYVLALTLCCGVILYGVPKQYFIINIIPVISSILTIIFIITLQYIRNEKSAFGDE